MHLGTFYCNYPCEIKIWIGNYGCQKWHHHLKFNSSWLLGQLDQYVLFFLFGYVLATVFSTIFSGNHQRKHQRSVSLAFVMGMHQWPVDSPHKGPVTRKMFLFVMSSCNCTIGNTYKWNVNNNAANVMESKMSIKWRPYWPGSNVLRKKTCKQRFAISVDFSEICFYRSNWPVAITSSSDSSVVNIKHAIEAICLRLRDAPLPTASPSPNFTDLYSQLKRTSIDW